MIKKAIRIVSLLLPTNSIKLRSLFLLLGLGISSLAQALSGQAYMDRFNSFTNWYEQLPLHATPEFLEFIKQSAPLSNKLRDKWLYELARTKDWVNYSTYYQPTHDINLVCYNQIAAYNLGRTKQALQDSIPLWLSGTSQPQSCNTLFDLLLKDKDFDQNLITQRIALALDKRNVQLARYLLKQYKTPHLKQIEALTLIQQNPANIAKLNTNDLNSDFYLYALKNLVSINMNKAIQLWLHIKDKSLMSEAKKQEFLAHIALYKAMRNHDDAQNWFSYIKPEYYSELLTDWRIRFALKNQDWKEVSELIDHSKNKDLPCWQYWLARSLEKQGKAEQAAAIYEPLAKNRHYYGFLASMRLKHTPSFENEKPSTHLASIKAYQPFVEQIKLLYLSKQNLQASRKLNDFISELPKDEASALVYWIENDLQWYEKSVALSNNELLNNQLSLRFPLAYRNTINQFAKQYAVSPEFIYAIIRQESGFREEVVSTAGARGLMQIMPTTALVVSKANRIAYKDKQQLFGSEKNINIGVAYLKQLTSRFSNHPILVAAAYNAGPKQVVYWLKNHPPKEVDLWIETLPWQETRNYLKNVMAFCIVYQFRLNHRPDMRDFLQPLSASHANGREVAYLVRS